MKEFEALKPRLDQMQTRALMIGLVAAALSAYGAYANTGQFFEAYLIGYLFWIGIALGSFALVALHHLVGGGWGFVIQRLLEAASRTIPLMAVLFIPFLFGMQDLFVWARPESVAADPILQHKAKYLNVPFFIIRAAGYFLLWFVFIFFLTGWSRKQDKTENPSLTQKIARISGPAILLYVLTVTFASIDWGMALEPHWFSTIYGFVFVIGQGLLTLAFAIVVLRGLSEFKPLAEVVRKQHFHDLGNLMLAFTMLWAYISLSQFLIIWSGNLPEEITWYLHRLEGGWGWMALAIVAFHFAIPFIVLLSRRTKRNKQVLAWVALGMIVMRFVDLYWVVAPSFHAEHMSLHWLDIVIPVAIGGLWVSLFIINLKGENLLPVHDPRLKQVLQHE